MSSDTKKTIDDITDIIYNTDNKQDKITLIRARSCLYRRYIAETNDKYLQDLIGDTIDVLHQTNADPYARGYLRADQRSRCGEQ